MGRFLFKTKPPRLASFKWLIDCAGVESCLVPYVDLICRLNVYRVGDSGGHQYLYPKGIGNL